MQKKSLRTSVVFITCLLVLGFNPFSNHLAHTMLLKDEVRDEYVKGIQKCSETRQQLSRPGDLSDQHGLDKAREHFWSWLMRDNGKLEDPMDEDVPSPFGLRTSRPGERRHLIIFSANPLITPELDEQYMRKKSQDLRDTQKKSGRDQTIISYCHTCAGHFDKLRVDALLRRSEQSASQLSMTALPESLATAKPGALAAAMAPRDKTQSASTTTSLLPVSALPDGSATSRLVGSAALRRDELKDWENISEQQSKENTTKKGWLGLGWGWL